MIFEIFDFLDKDYEGNKHFPSLIEIKFDNSDDIDESVFFKKVLFHQDEEFDMWFDFLMNYKQLDEDFKLYIDDDAMEYLHDLCCLQEKFFYVIDNMSKEVLQVILMQDDKFLVNKGRSVFEPHFYKTDYIREFISDYDTKRLLKFIFTTKKEAEDTLVMLNVVQDITS